MTLVGTRNEATRNAWVEKTLKAIPAGVRILDAGAGEGRYRACCAHLAYVAQDFARYDGRGDGRGLQPGVWDQSQLDIVSDITAIPEPDGSFGAILCIEVLEHLPEPTAALREFRRLLAGNGTLILTAPFCSLTHFAPYHFATGFSRYFYEHHLGDLGFDILEIVPNGNFFEYLAQEVRRVPDVARRYCGNLVLSAREQGSVHEILPLLERLSAQDTGSAEFLCFGHHVLARKRQGTVE